MPAIALILLAQMPGPVCGWNYGVELTPQNSPLTGCTVPDASGRLRTRLRMDPFAPGGVRAEPTEASPFPPVHGAASPVMWMRPPDPDFCGSRPHLADASRPAKT